MEKKSIAEKRSAVEVLEWELKTVMFGSKERAAHELAIESLKREILADRNDIDYVL